MRNENVRDTELLDTVLKDKLEFAYKSQRLEKSLLSERVQGSSKKNVRAKEPQQMSAKCQLNEKTKKKVQLGNKVHDINQQIEKVQDRYNGPEEKSQPNMKVKQRCPNNAKVENKCDNNLQEDIRYKIECNENPHPDEHMNKVKYKY